MIGYSHLDILNSIARIFSSVEFIGINIIGFFSMTLATAIIIYDFII